VSASLVGRRDEVGEGQGTSRGERGRDAGVDVLEECGVAERVPRAMDMHTARRADMGSGEVVCKRSTGVVRTLKIH
jgi:hypothetical protein